MAPVIADETAPSGFVVGFDLDMTLIDSRPGIGAVWHRIVAETGVDIDVDTVISRLGPPLEDEAANWFPAERVPEIAARYRALYPEHAITPALALPGARAALAAVRRHGGRVLVVTAKHAPSAWLHIEHIGLPVDELAGRRWLDGKAEALREHRAGVYVGDQPSDMIGARRAGALAVGVPTGSASAADLREAGADIVLNDLTRFPDWLAGHLTTASGEVSGAGVA
jgi:phosphoglycolate phosphatase